MQKGQLWKEEKIKNTVDKNCQIADLTLKLAYYNFQFTQFMFCIF